MSRYNLGITLFEAGYGSQAVNVLQDVIVLKPDDGDAHAGLGASLALSGQHDVAIKAFRKAIELNPLEIDTYCRLSESLNALESFEAAVEVLRAGLEVDATSADLHCHLGISLMLLGLLRPAFEALQYALQVDDDHQESHYQLGRVLRRLGKISDANEHFRMVIDINPTHILARTALAEGAYALGDYNAAHEIYSDALQFDGEDDSLLFGLGVTLLMLRKPSAAERVFDVLSQLHPSNTRAWLGRGMSAERQQGGFERAIASYQSILRFVDENHFGANIALANAYAKSANYHQAVTKYRWCLEKKPTDENALVR